MIEKSDLRILSLMLEKANRLVNIIESYGRNEIYNNYLIGDAIQFEFAKLYEDSTRLSAEIRISYGDLLHIDDLRGIRNRIAHDYESVVLDRLINTIRNDFPNLINDISSLLSSN